MYIKLKTYFINMIVSRRGKEERPLAVKTGIFWAYANI